jgi:predicted  nucleic acid-binding Zn-ribbon protein
MPKETTNEEILQAINDFAGHTEKRFDNLETDVNQLKTDVSLLKTDMTHVKSSMVTKDYLDDKLADLRGDLVVLTRKEDHKVAALVDILKQRKVLTEADAKKIMSMEPFPQIT